MLNVSLYIIVIYWKLHEFLMISVIGDLDYLSLPSVLEFSPFSDHF